MNDPVIKGASYVLVHTPGLAFQYGSTQESERQRDPDSDYLAKFFSQVRSYDEALSYPPYQTFVGNMRPDELAGVERPWYEGDKAAPQRYGPFGEIAPEDEFLAWMRLSDSFDLVWLQDEFVAQVGPALERHPLITAEDIEKIGPGRPDEDIRKALDEGGASPLRIGERLVGCVRRGHETDLVLTAPVIAENTCTKASGILALRHLIHKGGLDPAAIDYIIECSEEACGDMNQRGGGNFAKAIGELCGCEGATGSDTRGFCAAPVHAIVLAAALVKSGVFANVAVVAGGAAAKLGMNGKEHVKKGLPVLEDVLGGFALLVSANDGVSPVIRTDSVGKHNIGSGSSPQAVMQALVADPLERLGLTIADVDKYSAEMQIPEFTEPAGAGDVPAANFKMIAALAVMKKQLERSEIPDFVAKHGMPGFAPTQGHIPSGVPYIGHALNLLGEGAIDRVMIIGKGSLFLGRMTNLFDGISFLLESNPGLSSGESADEETVRKLLADAFRQVAQHMAGAED